MSQAWVIRADTLPVLLQNFGQLQNEVATANLGDLNFVRETNNLLHSLSSLNEIGDAVRDAYYYAGRQTKAHDLETVMEILEKIQKDALKASFLLRQAALQVVIRPAIMPEYQSRLKTLLVSLYLSLASLIKVSKGKAELPLFCSPNSLPLDNESGY